MCVCVCVSIPLYLWNYAVDFDRSPHFFVFFFLFCIREEHNFLLFTESFLFYFEFLIFVKFVFEFF